MFRTGGTPGVYSTGVYSTDVYSIGVVEDARRRGIGKAMTLAVLRLGRDAGCRIGVLQSSKMGYPRYEAMGFESVETYHHFEPVTQRA